MCDKPHLDLCGCDGRGRCPWPDPRTPDHLAWCQRTRPRQVVGVGTSTVRPDRPGGGFGREVAGRRNWKSAHFGTKKCTEQRPTGVAAKATLRRRSPAPRDGPDRRRFAGRSVCGCHHPQTPSLGGWPGRRDLGRLISTWPLGARQTTSAGHRAVVAHHQRVCRNTEQPPLWRNRPFRAQHGRVTAYDTPL